MSIKFIIVVFLYVVSNFVVFLQTPTDVQQKPSSKLPAHDYVPTPDTWDTNPNLKSLWVYRPPSVQSQHFDEQMSHRVVLRPPHILTRLAKPFSYGFDPVFHKTYFEPFERRQRPVTLVAFRKNGLLPKKMADTSNPGSSEVAELQSPFNDISTFWQDDDRFIHP